MSSSVPSAGDDNPKGKTRITNNLASRDIVILLTTERKGKGVSMTEEPDPEAISPMNHIPMPASGPVLTGPHTTNSDTPEGMTSSPAAFQSASRVPSASKSSSKLPAASRSVNITKPSTSDKGACKPSTTGANQPAASEQQPQKRLPDIVQASREELLNLKAVIQSGTRDNDTQTSSSTTEKDETE